MCDQGMARAAVVAFEQSAQGRDRCLLFRRERGCGRLLRAYRRRFRQDGIQGLDQAWQARGQHRQRGARSLAIVVLERGVEVASKGLDRLRSDRAGGAFERMRNALGGIELTLQN